jgi:hypothetical protein
MPPLKLSSTVPPPRTWAVIVAAVHFGAISVSVLCPAPLTTTIIVFVGPEMVGGGGADPPDPPADPSELLVAGGMPTGVVPVPPEGELERADVGRTGSDVPAVLAAGLGEPVTPDAAGVVAAAFAVASERGPPVQQHSPPTASNATAVAVAAWRSFGITADIFPYLTKMKRTGRMR